MCHPDSGRARRRFSVGRRGGTFGDYRRKTRRRLQSSGSGCNNNVKRAVGAFDVEMAIAPAPCASQRKLVKEVRVTSRCELVGEQILVDDWGRSAVPLVLLLP